MLVRRVRRALWVFHHIVELCVLSGANAQSSHFKDLQLCSNLVLLSYPVAKMHLKLWVLQLNNQQTQAHPEASLEMLQSNT